MLDSNMAPCAAIDLRKQMGAKIIDAMAIKIGCEYPSATTSAPGIQYISA
jgi:hypothetical protein